MHDLTVFICIYLCRAKHHVQFVFDFQCIVQFFFFFFPLFPFKKHITKCFSGSRDLSGNVRHENFVWLWMEFFFFPVQLLATEISIILRCTSCTWKKPVILRYDSKFTKKYRIFTKSYVCMIFFFLNKLNQIERIDAAYVTDTTRSGQCIELCFTRVTSQIQLCLLINAGCMFRRGNKSSTKVWIYVCTVHRCSAL